MNVDPAVFFTGIFIGTGLLIVGLIIGWYFGRRAVGVAAITRESLEQRQILDFIKNFATFTNEFAGDFSKYQAKLTSLSQTAESKASGATRDDVKSLINEILDANRSLQSRLDSAEVRLEEQTRELAEYLTEARTDALTGLPNRRSFDQGVDESFKAFKEKKVTFTIALLDIDFFKSVNDNLGHPAGDAVLVEVANRLKAFVSADFKIGRYGGEEFAVLIVGSLKNAAGQIEKLRLSIAAVPVVYEEKDVRITVSCGLAEVRADERIGNLFGRSDQALYAAKVAGRNRVYLHNGSICEPFGKPGDPEQPRFQKTENVERQASDEKSQLEQAKLKLQARFDEIVAKELHR